MYTNIGYNPAYTAYAPKIGFQGLFSKKIAGFEKFRLEKDEWKKIKGYQSSIKTWVSKSTMNLKRNKKEIIDYINGKKAEPTITVNTKTKSIEDFTSPVLMLNNLIDRGKGREELLNLENTFEVIADSSRRFAISRNLDNRPLSDDQNKRMYEVYKTSAQMTPILASLRKARNAEVEALIPYIL
jgi:hypothetical protein